MSKLIKRDYNEYTGVTMEYYANLDGSVTVRQFQDVEENLISNRLELNEKSSKSRHSMQEGLGRKVASIPASLAPVIKKDTGIDIFTASPSQLKTILNNRDFSKLRTAHGRL